ncbi:MAG: isoleucine--tRNA ligase [Myxococcota bacterium]|nr:isoleucine--tRNA ligase [Myxococcales bacterium]
MPTADAPSPTPYPEVEAQPHFPDVEKRVLAYWREHDVFRRSVEQRPTSAQGGEEFVFYDGPPFANGLPHYGHLITSYIKDIVPRYQTMRGKRVERRFGWDCHGLPAEMEAEKELGVSGRAQIIDFGIDRFNDHCRTSVMKYTREWERYVNRAARWVDFENDYKTLDLSYMESTIWALKQLWERGLLYESYRVMPYSWAAQTPLSNHETRLDDSYRERQDPALTVRFELVPASGDALPTDLLAWTTTPWTLPSNLALAVGPEIDYAVLELDGRRVVLGEAAVEKYASELGSARRVGSVRGAELAGRRYRPLFPFFEHAPLDGIANAFQVLAADFVDTAEGTGVVHLAPGFGEDDMEVCAAAGIPVVCPVDDAGCFTSEVAPWAGVQVFEANRPIARELRERGRVLRHETYVHNYPHCWRTDTPLIYRAVDSWYVKVTGLRERMVEHNRGIRWVPEHVRDGLFGKWLEGARDWSISRNRFWGTPITVWKSDDPAYPRIDVYGSLDELERDFGVRLTDLHRPTVDALVRKNPDDPTGRSTMRRVPDVLDCWFESGSMPYAQVHYPFENKEWFESHFPADFITEYTAQTRGWFYVMTVLATALFDRPPFRNCICHGVIQAEDGKKLSKRLRNYPDIDDVFERIGSDALRWYLVSSPIMKGGDLKIDQEGKAIAESVRLVINPIWNAYSFFCLYANIDGVRARLVTRERAASLPLLDRYVLAKTRALVAGIGRDLDAYDIAAACARVTGFIDALNNWYIRRSRARFWAGAGEGSEGDKRDAYDTLYTALVTLCRAAAPLLPLVLEEVHRGLTGEESVHLCDWPDVDALPEDDALVRAMDDARDACSAALALRAARNVRVRQPLAKLTVAGPRAAALAPFAALIADEVNVKRVETTEDVEAFATFRLKVNARAVGPRLGGETKRVIAASKQGDWRTTPGGGVEVGGTPLEPGEYELLLDPKEGVACEPLPGNDAIAVLDLALTDALVDEGRARDLVRVVQQARKEAGLHVADRIALAVRVPEAWRASIDAFAGYVKEQTLAVSLAHGDGAEGDFAHAAGSGDEALRVALRRV